jgi:hypothetical protein
VDVFDAGALPADRGSPAFVVLGAATALGARWLTRD